MKKNKHYRITQKSATRSTSQLKTALRKINWRLTGTVAGLTVLFCTVYQVCMAFEFAAVMWVYYAALLILIIAYLIMNRGISRTPPTPDRLPAEWDDAKKTAYIEADTVRKKKAKILLIFIIPLIFNFLFETVYLFYLDPLITDYQRYKVINL